MEPVVGVTSAQSVDTWIFGLHDVRIPVSDPWSSRDWYVNILGFVPLLDVEEEKQVTGVVLRHPNGMTIGLHRDQPRARCLKGFSLLGLIVEGPEQLNELIARLQKMGVNCSALQQGHLGTYIDVPDPDGIVVRIRTGSSPDTEEA